MSESIQISEQQQLAQTTYTRGGGESAKMNDILYGGMMDVVIRHWVVPRLRCTPSWPIPTPPCRMQVNFLCTQFLFARAPLKTKLQTPPRINAAHTNCAARECTECEFHLLRPFIYCHECESGANNMDESMMLVIIVQKEAARSSFA